jgi:hypothetical protein
MYKLNFKPDRSRISPIKAEEKYLICIQSLVNAAKPAPFEAWDDVIGLLKKLKSIGVPDSENPRGFVLKFGGGVVELERGERNQLIEFIKSAPWIPAHLDIAKTTLKWVQDTEEVAGSS